MKRLFVVSFVFVFAAVVWVRATSAIPAFQKEFYAKYLTDDTNEEYVTTVKEAKCFLCHVGKKKKNRNVYGEALSELLDKKKDKKDKEKIQAALDQVAEMKVEDKDDSPTFGDLIREGKLPGGPPQKTDPE